MKTNYIKLFITIIILIINGINGYSQTITYYRDPSKKEIIDTCKYAITYTFKYLNDTVKKVPYYDRHILEIGNRYSHYYSVYAARLDSVHYVYSQPNKRTRENKNSSDGYNPLKEANLQNNEKARYEDYYKDYPYKNDLTVSMAIEYNEYAYTETRQNQKWKFSSDTTTILGYKCMKATTTFRGRDYEVWFTPFIPISQNLWKFDGLSGLILKAKDTKGYFEWTAIGIEKPQNKHIYAYQSEKAKNVKTSRENVQKLQRKLWEDPAGLIVSQGKTARYRINGKTEEARAGLFQFPYIPPLELE